MQNLVSNLPTRLGEQVEEDTAANFKIAWQSVVDDALDMFDMFIKSEGESDEQFLARFQSGDALLLAIPSLRRILSSDLTGKIEDKPYEQIRTSSFIPQGHAAAGADDNWMANTDL